MNVTHQSLPRSLGWRFLLAVRIGIVAAVALLSPMRLFAQAPRSHASQATPPTTDSQASFDDVPVIGAASREPVAKPVGDNAGREDAGREDAELAEELDVPFLVLGCAPSTDGRHAVFWGYDWPTEPTSHPHGDSPRPTETRLAMLDLATRKVLAERKFAAVIAQVDCNASGVYVTATGNPNTQGLTVLRLSSKDLQSLDRATISPGKIISVADRFLISERPENGGNRKYVLPSLQPANPETAPINTFTKSQPVRRLADGWLLDGVLWDESLKTPRLLLSPLGFVRPGWTTSPRTSTIVAAPILHGYAIHARSGSPPNPRNWRLDRARYSPYVPAILTLNIGRGKTRLNFADYASGRILRTVTLCEGSSPRKALLATTQDWILVTLDGNTFITPTKNEQDPIAIPFRIQPRQSTLVLSAVEPVDVSYHAPDATKYELELPGIHIGDGFLKQQSRTGKFTIDLTAAVPEIVKYMNDVANHTRRAFKGDVAAWAESYSEQTHEQFVRLVGREPDGVPLILDAYVRAYSKDLSVAVMHHVYLIELPTSEFLKYQREPPTPQVVPHAETTRPPPAHAPPPPHSETNVSNGLVRTWTDTQGRTLSARFVRVEGNVVIVVDRGQRTLRLPLDRLGAEDREWVAAQPQSSGDEE